MTLRRAAVLALAIAALAAGAPSASASPPQLAVAALDAGGGAHVSYLVVAAEPGRRTAAGTIVVTNHDSRPVTIDVDPVSALTAANLGSAYALPGQPLDGPAAWTRATPERLALDAGESSEVAVVVDVPESQPDGEYLSGVAIEARGQKSGPRRSGEVAIASAQRYVVGVQTDIGSARAPALAFAGASVERQPAGVAFLVRMANRGTAILKDVHGAVTVERDGRRVVGQPIGPGTFVTGTSIAFPVPAPSENPAEGTEYEVRAVVHYMGRTARLDEMVTFGTEAAERQERFGGRPIEHGLPWLWIALGALLALALAAAAALRVRRRGRARLETRAGLVAMLEAELAAASGEPATVVAVGPLPDDPSLAEQFGIALRGRLRHSDVLTEPVPGMLVVLAPRTGPSGAAALVEDAERLAGYVGGATTVRARTARAPVSAEQVLAEILPPLPTGAEEPFDLRGGG
jgi:hypothetical protein